MFVLICEFPESNQYTLDTVVQVTLRRRHYSLVPVAGPGCQVAGFLTVFASELSVYTLTVITGERWYAITHALHLDRRLRLGTAGRVMAAGWLYAVSMAALPLLGVSGYSRTSICLPMENRDAGDTAYLATLLLVNALAFALVCACYARIYCAIRGSGGTRRGAAARSDATVAKRMALLVFTDFACWAPVAFFGLTALAGRPLLGVPRAKILLVCFYPLNACANPVLYALLTKQYRRDLRALLGRGGRSGTASRGRKEPLAAAANHACSNHHAGPHPPPGVATVATATATGLFSDGPGRPAGSPPQAPQSDAQPRPTSSPPSEGVTTSSSSQQQPRGGSPHPLRNSNTRLNLSGDQELVLKRALLEAQAHARPPSPAVYSDSHL
ncbi:thyrotropin receptor-like [Schistocerca americana]|uniref:thyrotropin receptor-like n=1 Tax=Schistocerca americana TaxID=7009 RepID=UPI001F4F7BF9|nr:thyrotropin receptor-like [Schistocerca americana]